MVTDYAPKTPQTRNLMNGQLGRDVFRRQQFFFFPRRRKVWANPVVTFHCWNCRWEGYCVGSIYGPSLLHVDHNEGVSEWVRIKDNLHTRLNKFSPSFIWGRSVGHTCSFLTLGNLSLVYGVRGGSQKPVLKWGLVDQGIRALSSLDMWVIFGSLVRGLALFLSISFWFRTNCCPIFNSDRRRQRVLTK